MSDVESDLAAALHARADEAMLGVDTAGAFRRLESRLDHVDQSRRRTRVGLVAVGAIAAAIAGVVLVGSHIYHSAPQPVAPHILGGEVVAARPFLSKSDLTGWQLSRQRGAAMRVLSRCVDPPGWGALKSRAATYREPARPPTRVNEYVLQYATPAAAQQAFMDAWRQTVQCPKRASDRDHGIISPADPVHPAGAYDEGFVRQRDRADGPGSRSHYAWYTLRVARAGNVLIVVESIEIPWSETSDWLAQAVRRALPQYRQEP